VQANRLKLIRHFLCLCLFSFLGIISTNRCAAQSNASVDFTSEVQPIFQARCILCHGSEVQMGGLRLDQRQNLLKGGKSGVPAIVAGKSAESLLVRYISGLDPKLVMPPTGERLSAGEISRISLWIDQGAVWPDETQRRPPRMSDRACSGSPAAVATAKDPDPLVRFRPAPLEISTTYADTAPIAHRVSRRCGRNNAPAM